MTGSVWSERCIFAPSAICLDLCNLEAAATECERAGIRLLHIDIIDGHFSPSLPLGLETVRQLRQKTSLGFDCHIMAVKNEYFIDELLDMGAEQIIFHAETEFHIDAALNRIRRRGVRAGLALKPATPLCVLDYALDLCDTVLLMLINPGYASQSAESQIPYGAQKILALRDLIERRGLPVKIEVDGRVSVQNIRDWGGSLADIFVVGSTCLDKSRISESVHILKAARTAALGEDNV